MSAGPRIELPRVLLTPLAGTPLVIAVCQECWWSASPSTRQLAAIARAHHRMEHKRGAAPAPLYEQRRGLVGHEVDGAVGAGMEGQR